jgi:hypothetical protein
MEEIAVVYVTIKKISASYNVFDEDSSLLGCYAVSTRKQLSKFQRNVVFSSSG